MARSGTRWSRVLTIGVVATLVLGACGDLTATIGVVATLVLGACGDLTATSSTLPPGTTSAPASRQTGTAAASTAAATTSSEAPTAGGTIYVLVEAEQWNQVDPQRAYYGDDLAFFSATIYRSLTAYKPSADPTEGTSLTPDLATDLGTATDGGKTWSFTLRDGVTFQDGSPITCADVKYGVSRTFATGVINQGPTYAIAYLDIPSDADGSSSYKGPYTGVGQDLYDKAVECSADGKTITFHLSKPIADFNYTVTLGFSPVPRAADTGQTYGTTVLPVSSGPYQVDSYTTGNGGKMVLVRNPNWKQASDPYRTPYPGRWEVDFGIDPQVLDQRIMQSSGNDAYAISYRNVQPENLAVIFKGPETPNPDFEGRAISGFDLYTLYLWIDVNKVPNVKIRQAMAVALDRSSMRLNAGGAFVGEYADGVVKPNIGADYAPTGMWTDLLGKVIPDTGDPEYARQLIAESGEAAPTLVFNFADTPVNQKDAAIVIASLGKAGISGHAGSARVRQVLERRLRPGVGRRLRPGRLGPGLAERLDHHPADVHREGWLGPLASGRPSLQREGRSRADRARPHEAGHDVAGAQQGGDAERLDDPDLLPAQPYHRRYEGRVHLPLGGIRLLAVRRDVRQAIGLQSGSAGRRCR